MKYAMCKDNWYTHLFGFLDLRSGTIAYTVILW